MGGKKNKFKNGQTKKTQTRKKKKKKKKPKKKKKNNPHTLVWKKCARGKFLQVEVGE